VDKQRQHIDISQLLQINSAADAAGRCTCSDYRTVPHFGGVANIKICRAGQSGVAVTHQQLLQAMQQQEITTCDALIPANQGA
jgi:hypothetical protein